jgi:hypothetical protein
MKIILQIDSWKEKIAINRFLSSFSGEAIWVDSVINRAFRSCVLTIKAKNAVV